MTDVVDPNQMAAQLISQQIANIVEYAGSKFSKLLGGAQVQFRIGLTSYLEALHDRLSKVKTLLYRDVPIPIEKIYVGLTVQAGKKKISDAALLTQIKERAFIVLTGTAGTGKSMLMRHLFLRTIAAKKQVPIFFELRHLNSSAEKSLLDSVIAGAGAAFPFSADQFLHGLKLGIFTFFFDGFDEINHDQRERIEQEILRLSIEFPENRIVVSSRPDDTFASWNMYHVLKVLPLSRAQTIKLLKKLDYDAEVKAKFIAEVHNSLYVRHEEFLSNPLLATMMLLTYDQFADIPTKVHVFYQQAFETLFQKHDALKSVYRRKNYSGLAIDEFKRAFACFCALTYFDEKFSFNDEDVRNYVAKALLVSGAQANAEDFSRDMLESVCVLQRDGLNLVFVHRSFQEYFTSYFIVALNGDRAGAFVERLVQRPSRFRDNVIDICFDMNPDIIEGQWALPALKRIVDELPAEYEFEAAFRAICVSQILAIFDADGTGTLNWASMDVHFVGRQRFAETHVLGRLYSWTVWTRDVNAASIRERDGGMLKRMVGGEISVHRPTAKFSELLGELMQGKLRPEWNGRVFDVSEDPFHERNLQWARDTTIDRYLRSIWKDARETYQFVSSRAVAREQLFDGLLSGSE